MLLEGLERGFCEYNGTLIKQPRKDIRPAPFKSFKGRTYAAAVSPESVRIMAKLGVGILIIPQKPWDVVTTELNDYRQIFRTVNGVEAPNSWPWNSNGVPGPNNNSAVSALNRPGLVSWCTRWPRLEFANWSWFSM